MKFVKMHGCGNDYVYLDGVTEVGIARRVVEPGWAELVRAMSDRHKGIGSDGVIVVCRPTATSAHVRMRMFNADGSESEMCGNGVRCVAKFAHDRLGVGANPMLVETGRGVLSIECEVVAGRGVAATVDMGEPILEAERIPVQLDTRRRVVVGVPRTEFLWESLDAIAKGQGVGEIPLGPTATCVSMGNPHVVFWGPVEFEHPEDQLIAAIGPWLEDHPIFPSRVNVHIVDVIARDRAKMLTWERGSGITQACGTGACAAAVAGVLEQKLDRDVAVEVLGGELRIRWDEATDHVFMSGEAVDVFEGEWPNR